MRRIRVTIDAVPLLLRSAGVKTYLYYWIHSLVRHAGADAVRLFPFLDPAVECVHESSPLGRMATLARLSLLHLANGCPVPLLNPLGARSDIFHASHQLVRPPSNTCVTATLYDMTCWLVPEMHSPANVRAAKKFARRVLGRASGIIAISEATRRDALRILGLREERVKVIYPGVADGFFRAKPSPCAKPYVLFVGTIEPRKNLGVLLDAYQDLPADLRNAYDLVVAGSPGWGEPGVLMRLRSGFPGVRYLGYVPEDRLPSLTAGATAFVYPSLYEGFGLPVAQAMAAGVPVITSNVSSLPEVAGDAALLVDPRSTADVRAALARLLTSPDLRIRLGAAGKLRAPQYSWDRAARCTWEFFEQVST